MNKFIEEKRPRIYFTGVGGQGTLTATKILAQAAMDAGIDVIAGEVHGMAQRGGVVESALLLGGWKAPRLDAGEADIILGFEPLETLRALPYLNEGGVIFSSVDPMPPLSVNLGQAAYPDLSFIESETRKVAAECYLIPCDELGIKAGTKLSGNTALLGAVCASGLLPFTPDTLEKAINRYLPEKIRKVNIDAMNLGVAWMQKHKSGEAE